MRDVCDIRGGKVLIESPQQELRSYCVVVVEYVSEVINVIRSSCVT